MTFEEFFKKKRIDLDTLKVGEPGLFAEFKTHYEQMGEKSFDHTKKYWFNKTRRQFPLAIEIKTERIKIENPLAEQTVTQALTETLVAVEENKPKLGFVPKFKATSTPKPAAENAPEAETPVNDPSTEESTPKLGFKPKFKAASIPKPVSEEAPVAEMSVNDAPVEPSAPKLGFKPKFKGANMPKPVAENKIEQATPPAESAVEPTTPKLGFKPKFKPTQVAQPMVEKKPADISDTNQQAAAEPKPQLYKPRFNMKNIPPKATEE